MSTSVSTQPSASANFTRSDRDRSSVGGIAVGPLGLDRNANRRVIDVVAVRHRNGDREPHSFGNVPSHTFDLTRYEIRLWHGGHIPDVAEAVDSPRRLTDDKDRARRVLDLIGQVPTPMWGRDELATGEMWNSNSVIAWVISRSGIDTESIQPPAGGRAPGWHAGLVVAREQDEEAARTARVEGVHTAPGA